MIDPALFRSLMLDFSHAQNRELQIMRLVEHRNICSLKAYFYSNGDKKDEVFLNLTLEYIPETIYRASRHYAKIKQTMPMLYIKVRWAISVLRVSPGSHRLLAFFLAVHVPTLPIARLHPLTRHLSPGHKASKPALRSPIGRPQAV